ncbi:MAG: hypothetical protein JXA90_02175 [Planctomycetes bacterium]|nr:hypothetical protein [Planctomycetota bacterium]
MHLVFLICAVAGGTILVIQILLLVIGLDSGGDADLDVGAADLPDEISDDVSGGYVVDAGEGASGEAATSSFTVISFKTLNAFFTFFGLGGLLGESYDFGVVGQLVLAGISGCVAFYLVAYLWMLLRRLQSQGNVNLKNAVGATGKVYLRVPPKGEGRGKVTVSVQDRTVEVAALSQGEGLATGTPIRVVGLVGSDTVTVVPVEENKETANG